MLLKWFWHKLIFNKNKMENFIKDFFDIFTTSGLLALINIIIIDLVMSWDNAIVIWMATKNLSPILRKKAIFIWITLATIFRVVLSIFAVSLMKIVWIKFIWWLLLLYIVWKFYKELRIEESEDLKIKSSNTLMSALHTILIADISMSLDNVLWVSWASHWNMAILVIWLVFSIILMAFASGYIARKLDNNPQIQWLWLFVILFVSMWMLSAWSTEVVSMWIFLEWTSKVSHFKLLPFIVFLLWIFFIYLHKKYLQPFNEYQIKWFVDKNYLKILLAFFSLILVFLFLWAPISNYLNHNIEILYSLWLICFFAIVELIIYITDNKKENNTEL